MQELDIDLNKFFRQWCGGQEIKVLRDGKVDSCTISPEDNVKIFKRAIYIKAKVKILDALWFGNSELQSCILSLPETERKFFLENALKRNFSSAVTQEYLSLEKRLFFESFLKELKEPNEEEPRTEMIHKLEKHLSNRSENEIDINNSNLQNPSKVNASNFSFSEKDYYGFFNAQFPNFSNGNKFEQLTSTFSWSKKLN